MPCLHTAQTPGQIFTPLSCNCRNPSRPAPVCGALPRLPVPHRNRLCCPTPGLAPSGRAEWEPGWSELPREGAPGGGCCCPTLLIAPSQRGVTGAVPVSRRDDAAALFPCQGRRVRSLHEPSPSLRAGSGGKLLGLPLGVLGGAHGGGPPRRGAGQVGDTCSDTGSDRLTLSVPPVLLPPPPGKAPSSCFSRGMSKGWRFLSLFPPMRTG